MPAFKLESNQSKWLRLPELATAVGAIVGSLGSYILGAALVLPSQLFGIANEETLVAFGVQATILLTVSWALFRISHVLVVWIYIFGVFLYAKFSIERRFKIRTDHPKSRAFQNRRLREFTRREEGQARLLISRLLITFWAVWELMLDNAQPALQQKVMFYLIVGFGMVFLSFSSAFRRTIDGSPRKSNLSFAFSSEMFWFLAAMVSVAIVSFGALRTSHQMHSGNMYVVGAGAVCSLSGLVPVIGGELFYERETGVFVIVGAQRELVIGDRDTVPDNVGSCFH